MANQLYMPNMVQSFNRGYDRGQESRLNKLAGQLYTQPDNHNQLLGEIASISPGAANQLETGFQRRELAQEAGAMKRREAISKRLAGAANFMLQAHKSGNPQAVQGAWNAVRPFLAETSGQEPPEQFDPAMWPMIYQVAAANGANFNADPNSPAAVQAFEYFAKDMTPEQVERARAIHLGLAPRAGQPRLSRGYQIVQTPNGPVAQQIPIAEPGQSFTAPGTNGHDVSFNFAPGTPSSVVDAARAAAVANGDVSPQPTGTTGETLADVTGRHSGGNKIDQRAQEIADLRARGVDISDADAQTYLATGKLGSGFQGNSNADAFGNVELSGADYLQSIPSDERSVVKGVLNGTKELPRGSALKNPYWQSIMASVMHADPSWNEAAYKQYARTRKYFTTGKGGKLINNINTAMQHANELLGAINDLHNGEFTPWNSIVNTAQKAVGNQDVTNFNAIVTPLASELASVYKNGNAPTDQETQEWREMMTPDMSYGQQMNVLRRWIDLLTGKMNATRRQYQNSMSDLADPLTVVSKPAREAMSRIVSMADKVSQNPSPEVQEVNSTPIYAPGGGSVPQPTVEPVQSTPSGGDDIDAILQGLGVQ